MRSTYTVADSLVVLLHGQSVGEIVPGRDPSRIRLSIDPTYDASGITLTESFSVVPGTAAPTDLASNFLGGYLPEGNHRTVMASRRGVNPGDLFALLREFGASLAGAVTVLPPGAHSPSPDSGWLEQLSEKQLAERLQQAVRDTDQAVPDDSRSALPGFQPKVLVSKVGDGWAQPHGGAHSTYILKPLVPQRASRLFDEHYGNLLARSAGLAHFSCTIETADGVTYLAIERFDRHVLPDGQVELVHQEDLAQALGLDWRTSDAKFQDLVRIDNPQRASAARIAELLASIPGSSALLENWVNRFVFSLVLGDNDAHAKNIALIHNGKGTELAPAYDTVPNLYNRGMIEQGFRLALAVNGSFDHRMVTVESIKAEVASWPGLTRSRAESLVQHAIDRCIAAVRTTPAPPGLSDGLFDKLNWTTDQLLTGRPIGMSPWQAS
jgi:serine/threonine-protein kinase HipA